jgi:hypothetical protein
MKINLYKKQVKCLTHLVHMEKKLPLLIKTNFNSNKKLFNWIISVQFN